MTEVRSDTTRPVAIWAFLFAAIALVCANLPYLLGVFWTPPRASFTGLTYNADDGGVYLSWIRQAMEGNLTLHNRFTTEPQRGLLFNSLFFVLGTIAHITHLSPPVVYAGARVVFGVLLLWAVWRLVCTLLSDSRARLLAFALVCFASGFGFGSDFDPRFAYEQPIDRWQPEAITFLTLYYSPLFSAALALMAVFATSFFRAEQSGKWRDLIPAMIAGFLLGNFHSYDILQLFAMAAVYRIGSDIVAKRFQLAGYLRLAAVGLAMLPTVAYQYWAIRSEAVLNARVFDTSTLSPSLQWVLAGFGLPLLLTALALAVPRLRARLTADSLRFLVTWAVVAILISYVPASFQRKLLMGAHLPICIAAGAVLATLTERLSGSLPGIVSVFAVLLTIPSNLRFLVRDTAQLPKNLSSTQYRPYLAKDEKDALAFLEKNAKPTDAVLVCPDMVAQNYGATAILMPYLGVYVPAYSPATVYCAHWSETARFADKLKEETRFFRATTDDTWRQEFLQANTGIHYILYARNLGAGLTNDKGELLTNPDTGAPYFEGVDWSGGIVPSFLKPVYENDSVIIFAVAP